MFYGKKSSGDWNFEKISSKVISSFDIDKNDNPHIVWTDEFNNTSQFYYARTVNGSFNIMENTSHTLAGNGSLILDNNSKPHVLASNGDNVKEAYLDENNQWQASSQSFGLFDTFSVNSNLSFTGNTLYAFLVRGTYNFYTPSRLGSSWSTSLSESSILQANSNCKTSGEFSYADISVISDLQGHFHGAFICKKQNGNGALFYFNSADLTQATEIEEVAIEKNYFAVGHVRARGIISLALDDLNKTYILYLSGINSHFHNGSDYPPRILKMANNVSGTFQSETILETVDTTNNYLTSADIAMDANEKYHILVGQVYSGAGSDYPFSAVHYISNASGQKDDSVIKLCDPTDSNHFGVCHLNFIGGVRVNGMKSRSVR